jgi:hypothetical protein
MNQQNVVNSNQFVIHEAHFHLPEKIPPSQGQQDKWVKDEHALQAKAHFDPAFKPDQDDKNHKQFPGHPNFWMKNDGTVIATEPFL